MVIGIRYILIVGFLILGLISVSWDRGSEAEKIVGVKFSVRLDLVPDPSTMKLVVAQDSTFLYYYMDRVVMKLTVHESDFKPIKTDSGIIYSDEGQPERTKYRYFVFKKGERFGSFYGFNAAGPAARLKVDSVWKSRISFPPNIITNNVNSLAQLEESGEFIREYYVTKYKPDFSYCDSTILSFCKKLDAIPFTFNEALDKSRDMKLYKMQCIYKPYYDTTVNGTVPRREYSWEIGEAQTDAFVLKLLNEKK